MIRRTPEEMTERSVKALVQYILENSRLDSIPGPELAEVARLWQRVRRSPEGTDAESKAWITFRLAYCHVMGDKLGEPAPKRGLADLRGPALAQVPAAAPVRGCERGRFHNRLLYRQPGLSRGLGARVLVRGPLGLGRDADPNRVRGPVPMAGRAATGLYERVRLTE